MKPPELTFLLSEWKADTDGLSIEAKGAWMEVCMRAVDAKKRGTVSKTVAGWARVFGTDQEHADRIIAELKADGCARITIGPRNVTITSRRMAAERKVRESQTLRKRKQRDMKASHPNVTAPFERFWAAWPKHFRKVGKAKCWARWKKDGLDSKADHVIAVVESMKASEKWKEDRGKYIPGPIVWLNQQRWDCELEDVAAPKPHRPTGLSLRDKEIRETLANGGVLIPEMRAYWDAKQGGKEPKG